MKPIANCTKTTLVLAFANQNSINYYQLIELDNIEAFG